MSKVTIKLKKINGRRQVPRRGDDGWPGVVHAAEVSILEVIDIDGTTHSTYSRTASVDINKSTCYTCALSCRNNRTLVASQLCRIIKGCCRCTTIFERIEDSLEFNNSL